MLPKGTKGYDNYDGGSHRSKTETVQGCPRVASGRKPDIGHVDRHKMVEFKRRSQSGKMGA